MGTIFFPVMTAFKIYPLTNSYLRKTFESMFIRSWIYLFYVFLKNSLRIFFTLCLLFCVNINLSINYYSYTSDLIC